MNYELVSKAIIHKCFGTGIISSFDGRYMEVERWKKSLEDFKTGDD